MLTLMIDFRLIDTDIKTNNTKVIGLMCDICYVVYLSAELKNYGTNKKFGICF